MSGNFKMLVKGQEPVLCEASRFCWSLLKIYYVKLQGTIINDSNSKFKNYLPRCTCHLLYLPGLVIKPVCTGAEVVHSLFFLKNILFLCQGYLNLIFFVVESKNLLVSKILPFKYCYINFINNSLTNTEARWHIGIKYQRGLVSSFENKVNIKSMIHFWKQGNMVFQ